jgi:tRNA pseudouridine38-40 synthase
MRYFIEVAYKGTAYAGFQIQQNANTIQQEVEKALLTVYKKPIQLTGSSRTDAGVHALQNFFHFGIEETLQERVYNLNAVLPADISIISVHEVPIDLHARFSATSREYLYKIHQHKNVFENNSSYYFPYTIDLDVMNEAAALLLDGKDFTSFSKLHTQAFTNNCDIFKSVWFYSNWQLIYNVQANRFLRGMVRALVATMLQVGKGKISIDQFKQIIEGKNAANAFFAAPACGLYLKRVIFSKEESA